MKVVRLDSPRTHKQSVTENSPIERSGLEFSKLAIGMLFLLGIALLVRWHTVSANLPYFYNEDEAHHYNRVVEMVQRGDYNPNYFHKPSLHFYLRMPVVAASFLWTVKNGHIKSIQEIRTRDPNGLSGYSLTASHPGTVKWNRMLSVGFSIGIVLLSAIIAFQLTGASTPLLIAGLITALSPGLISYSGVIGVDMPTAFFCMSCISLSLWQLQSERLIPLLLACITAGFAVSTKYNALPILLLPLLSVGLNSRFHLSRILISLLLPVVAFFVASPYILVSLPLFLDQFAYEIWHYGVAAHDGHSAEPGFAQAIFYSKWLIDKGFGILVFCFAIAGLVALFKRPKIAIVALTFPLIYFVLMSSQKTHFERNMLLIIGIFPALAAYTFSLLLARSRSTLIRFSIYTALLVIFFSLGFNVWQERAFILQSKDSRDFAYSWLLENKVPVSDTIIEGRLQLPLFSAHVNGEKVLTLRGLKRTNLRGHNPLSFYQTGFNRVVHSEKLPIENWQMETKLHLEGSSKLGRIPKDPEIFISDFSKELSNSAPKALNVLTNAGIEIPELDTECSRSSESQCWTQVRVTKLIDAPENLVFESFSPWKNQRVEIFSSDGQFKKTINVSKDWQEFNIKLPTAKEIYIFNSEVHAPKDHLGSKDDRRLGIALRFKNESPL